MRDTSGRKLISNALRKILVILVVVLVLVCVKLMRDTYIFTYPPLDDGVRLRYCDLDHHVDIEHLAELTSENVERLQRLSTVLNTSAYSGVDINPNFSPDSRLLAMSGWNAIGQSKFNPGIIDIPTLMLWELPTACFTEFGNFDVYQMPEFAGFDPTSQQMFVNFLSCHCSVQYAVPEGRKITTLDALTPANNFRFFNADERNWGTVGEMSVISQENHLWFYESETGSLLRELPFEKTISSVSVSPNGRLIAIVLIGLRTNGVEIWAVPSSAN